MRRALIVLIALVFGASAPGTAAAQGRTSNTLDIYLVDVEGGNATLIVSPTGESLLIDTGNPSNGRDAERIIVAAKDAGLTQIDHLIITPWRVSKTRWDTGSRRGSTTPYGSARQRESDHRHRIDDAASGPGRDLGASPPSAGTRPTDRRAGRRAPGAASTRHQ